MRQRLDVHPDLAIASTHELVARGHTASSIRRLVASGRLTRLRKGRYTDVDLAKLWPEDRHLLQVHALARTMLPGRVISHESAAVLHRLPLTHIDLDRVRMTLPSPNLRSRQTNKSAIIELPLNAESIVEVDWIPTTSVARTIADLCRARSRFTSVSAADAAINRGLCTLDDIVRELQPPPSPRGMPRARIAVPEIDGRSESVGESISRLVFVEAGLPRPVLQREFVIDGRLYRSDFYWEDEKVIGEFDGLGKYLYETSESGRRSSLKAEKQRDQDFQSLGITPVHWTMSDLADPVALVARLRRAFRR